MKKPITERQELILNSVVETHIDTASPVGSNAVTGCCPIDASPATVRNEMSVLEEMGYLTHPHTSSGRVPTDSGYRYYVDHCLRMTETPERVVKGCEGDLRELSKDTPDAVAFVEQATRLLSVRMREASLAVYGGDEAMKPGTMKVFLQGSSHILEKPEFRDWDKLQALFRAFEEKMQLIASIQSQLEEKGVSIRIGRENPVEALRGCTVIAAQYTISGRQKGTLALVTPTRTRYAEAVPLLKSMAFLISHILDERF
jgi:heat-inducible transcriptional repressor